MRTKPVLTAQAFHWYREVDWERTAVLKGFVSYDVRTEEVYD